MRIHLDVCATFRLVLTSESHWPGPSKRCVVARCLHPEIFDHNLIAFMVFGNRLCKQVVMRYPILDW